MRIVTTKVFRVAGRRQGCQIGSFGVKNQKFAFFQKQLAPKFLFAYLATFWLFYNFFIPQIFLGEEL